MQSKLVLLNRLTVLEKNKGLSPIYSLRPQLNNDGPLRNQGLNNNNKKGSCPNYPPRPQLNKDRPPRRNQGLNNNRPPQQSVLNILDPSYVIN